MSKITKQTHWERDSLTHQPLYFVDIIFSHSLVNSGTIWKQQVQPQKTEEPQYQPNFEIITSFPEFIMEENHYLVQFLRQKREELNQRLQTKKNWIPSALMSEIIAFINAIPDIEQYYLPEFLWQDQLQFINHPTIQFAGVDSWVDWITAYDTDFKVVQLSTEIDRMTRLALIFIQDGWNWLSGFESWNRKLIKAFYESYAQLEPVENVYAEIEGNLEAENEFFKTGKQISAAFKSKITHDLLGYNSAGDLVFVYRSEDAKWPVRNVYL